MSKSSKIPRPKMGDSFYRHTLIGLVEEAMVVSMNGPEKHPEEWSAVVLTRTGTEFITSDQEFRSKHDWVPSNWMYDEERNCWVVPSSDDTEAKDAHAWQLPAPKAGERYMSWRARVFREVPMLKKDDSVNDILSSSWKSLPRIEMEPATAK